MKPKEALIIISLSIIICVLVYLSIDIILKDSIMATLATALALFIIIAFNFFISVFKKKG